jgi:hypothetical protein
MPEMHAIATWAASRVQEERFSLFIPIQNLVKFSMDANNINRIARDIS